MRFRDRDSDRRGRGAVPDAVAGAQSQHAVDEARESNWHGAGLMPTGEQSG